MDYIEYYHLYGALTGVAPLIVAGIISAIASMKASEDAKQAAATGAAGEAAGGGGGDFEMKPTDLLGGAEGDKKNQSYISDGASITKAALGAGPSISGTGYGQPEPSKINADLARADRQPALPQAPPVLTAGSTGDMGAVPGQQSQVDLGVQLPESTEIDTGGGDPSKMSLEAKMAMAAQLGSLMRGPAPPRPPSVGAGPGINMQPVFLKDLQ